MASTDLKTAPGALEAERRGIDWGRVVMVPFSLVFGSLSLIRLVEVVRGNGFGSDQSVLLAAVTGALTGAFYALIVWAYLRRTPARATSRVRLAIVAAPVATFLPFTLPFMAAGAASDATVLIGDLLIAIGLLWSVWSLRALDRSLSLIPQARQLVDHGPYAVVRHPLYLGEVVAMLGVAIALGGALPVVVVAVLLGLQCYRAVQEEALLCSALPGYDEYRSRTARVVPGVF